MLSKKEELFDFAKKIFPIYRSLTGPGIRKTLKIISNVLPGMVVREVPTGTKIYDWEIPPEWDISSAWIADTNGEKLIDFARNNLHVLGYSKPIRQDLNVSELSDHLHSLPDHPDWIPYRTSYYTPQWGFCITEKQKNMLLKHDKLNVLIDSELKSGTLTYGEYVKQGTSKEEILISTYICHPSLANDNVSGVTLAVKLAESLFTVQTRYTYRFIFVPETIGALTWLKDHEQILPRIKGGLVITCAGDPGPLTYKKTKRGDTLIDQVVEYALSSRGYIFSSRYFYPFGSDERQYSSPGFDLPIGSLMRTPYDEYPEYHTSADNLGLLSEDALYESFTAYLSVFETLEESLIPVRTHPYGEPKLSKYGLYRKQGTSRSNTDFQNAIIWILNQSDGNHTLEDVSKKSGIDVSIVKEAADILVSHNLIEIPK